jgi:hypothetical protein
MVGASSFKDWTWGSGLPDKKHRQEKQAAARAAHLPRDPEVVGRAPGWRLPHRSSLGVDDANGTIMAFPDDRHPPTGHPADVVGPGDLGEHGSGIRFDQEGLMSGIP